MMRIEIQVYLPIAAFHSSMHFISVLTDEFGTNIWIEFIASSTWNKLLGGSDIHLTYMTLEISGEAKERESRF